MLPGEEGVGVPGSPRVQRAQLSPPAERSPLRHPRAHADGRQRADPRGCWDDGGAVKAPTRGFGPVSPSLGDTRGLSPEGCSEEPGSSAPMETRQLRGQDKVQARGWGSLASCPLLPTDR